MLELSLCRERQQTRIQHSPGRVVTVRIRLQRVDPKGHFATRARASCAAQRPQVEPLLLLIDDAEKYAEMRKLKVVSDMLATFELAPDALDSLLAYAKFQSRGRSRVGCRVF